MNGAQSLLHSLLAGGVDTCFMNPGTSEMQFVAALDSVPEMRSVLTLFEGVATGAADGYARLAGRPASVLLHLGPGLGNGLANLHNARRARTPVVNVVGDHATYHKRYDAQLESDIETVARNVSRFVRRCESPGRVEADVAAAITAAHGPPGQVATLIVPADVSWSELEGAADAAGRAGSGAGPGGGSGGRAGAAAAVPDNRVGAAAAVLRSGAPAALLVGGRACGQRELELAGAIAAVTGARLLCETFPARLARGAGRVAVERLAYLGELATAQMEGLRHLVLVDARSPVSFFAYPGRASDLVPDGCQVTELCGPADDTSGALAELAASLGATPAQAPRQAPGRPTPPSGPLTPQSAAEAIASCLPEEAIVVDESNTAGVHLPAATAGCPPHDWLCLTGGAIGMGLPVAAGAAIACPDRRVVSLQADGSAMYTPQAWWTMAREGANVTTVVFANRSYAILNFELSRVGATAGGDRAKAMLDIGQPDLDFVSLARGLGVPATRATTADELAAQLGRALAAPGPAVVEAVLPPRL